MRTVVMGGGGRWVMGGKVRIYRDVGSCDGERYLTAHVGVGKY